MPDGAIWGCPVDLILKTADASGAAPSRQRGRRRGAFCLLDRILLPLGKLALPNQLFAPSQPFYKVCIWPPSFPSRCRRARLAFLIGLVCALVVMIINHDCSG